jgi:hypothetical protein
MFQKEIIKIKQSRAQFYKKLFGLGRHTDFGLKKYLYLFTSRMILNTPDRSIHKPLAAHHSNGDVNQGCWVWEYPRRLEKNKDWSADLRLGESKGVLGLKAEIDLIFTLLPLVMRDPNMIYIFPLYQPFINPSLQYSSIPSFQL